MKCVAQLFPFSIQSFMYMHTYIHIVIGSYLFIMMKLGLQWFQCLINAFLMAGFAQDHVLPGCFPLSA